MKYSLCFFCVIFSLAAYCQSVQKNDRSYQVPGTDASPKDSLRTLYFELNTGVLEMVGIGLGVQINNKTSLMIKWSGTFTGGQGFLLPNSGDGVGFQYSYYSKLWVFNSLNILCSKYLDVTREHMPRDKGYFFDVNFARVNTSKKFYNTYWSFGVCVSAARNTSLLVYPSIKYGVDMNLF